MTYLNVAGRPSIVTNAGRLNDREKEALKHTYLTDSSRHFEKSDINSRTVFCTGFIVTGILVAGVIFAIPHSHRLVAWSIDAGLVMLALVALWWVRRPVRQDNRMQRVRSNTRSDIRRYELNGFDLHPLHEACGNDWETLCSEIISRTDLGIELTGRVMKFIRELEKPKLFEHKLDSDREKQRQDEIRALADDTANDLIEAYIAATAHAEDMAKLRELSKANAAEIEIQVKQSERALTEAARNRLFDAVFSKGDQPLSTPRVVNTTPAVSFIAGGE